ncbi:MAG TPA: S9 family peptidase [Candidatus Acidoferrales bacterium]|nr:S9 family peptidase [Candidatus Acidoferrales bacterium]
MKASRFACLIILTLALALSASAASIDQILKYRNLSAVKVSSDGTRAVFVAAAADVEENAMNSDVWLVDLTSGRTFQLTRAPKRDNAPEWSPDGKRIAFLSDRGKDSKVNIWMISPEGGEAEAATKFDKLSVSSFRWLPDGSGFLFIAADPETSDEEKRKKDKEDVILVEKNYKYNRLYSFKLGDKEPKKLTSENYHVTNFDVSRDGKWVAFTHQPTPRVPDFTNADVKLLELSSGNIRELVTRPGADAAPRFSPDGQWISFESSFGRDAWHGNSVLWLVKPDGSGLRNLSESFDEEPQDAEWSADGKWIYYGAAQGVASRLFRIEVTSGKWEALSDHDRGKFSGDWDLDSKGRFIVTTFEDPETPEEVYQLDLAAKKFDKLTRVNSDFVGVAPKTEVLRYKSFDGMEIEGLVAKPRDFAAGKRYPLLVIIHGGPAGVFQTTFTPRRGAYPIFAFTDQGYVVFMPNPRGSGGYGEKFRQANVKDWGYGDYKDIMAGVDELIKQGVADADKMGVMGWSYGGYMTSWVVSQTTRFKAASMGAGLSNLISMYGTTDIPQFSEAYFGAKPWEDSELYLKHSAIRFVNQAKTPTLIQHGQEDRRVPISQGEEFYQALKDVGVPTEMVVYPRQPHGIQEPRLIKDALQRNLNWFNKWLLGIEPPAEKKETKKEEGSKSD